MLDSPVSKIFWFGVLRLFVHRYHLFLNIYRSEFMLSELLDSPFSFKIWGLVFYLSVHRYHLFLNLSLNNSFSFRLRCSAKTFCFVAQSLKRKGSISSEPPFSYFFLQNNFAGVLFTLVSAIVLFYLSDRAFVIFQLMSFTASGNFSVTSVERTYIILFDNSVLSFCQPFSLAANTF